MNTRIRPQTAKRHQNDRQINDSRQQLRLLRRDSCVIALAVATSIGAFSSVLADEDRGGCIQADYLLSGQAIYTADIKRPVAKTVGVLKDRITLVSLKEASAVETCEPARRIHVSEGTIFPGFTDAHQHLEGVGRRTKTLSLFGLTTLADTVSEIRTWASRTQPGDWILGRGWIEREWTDEQRFLTKHDVDPFTFSKPLFLPRADGVSALVNSEALRRANVTNSTPDPEGGRFERDPSGELTGYVLGNAMQVFRSIIPDDSDDYLRDNLLQGLKANAALGWTQTQDAGMSYRLVDLLKEIHEEGNMAHRVYVAVPVSEAESRFRRGREKTDDDFLDVRGIKVFIDGTLGSRGAALIEHYSDGDHNGFMDRTPKATLMPILRRALKEGVQIETHVIGDRAVRSLLDWYEAAFQSVPSSGWAQQDVRWRLEHAQIIQPEDQARFVALNVIPSMQPSHGIGDLNFAPDRLGPHRLKFAYPWRDLTNLGLRILGGSDAPVELGDPRIEFYAAVERKRLDGSSGSDWHPEQAVSRETALNMFTLWPAYGAFQEHLRGSIEVGKYADFTIFNADLMTIPAPEILEAEVLMTIVGGNIMFQKGKAPVEVVLHDAN